MNKEFLKRLGANFTMHQSKINAIQNGPDGNTGTFVFDKMSHTKFLVDEWIKGFGQKDDVDHKHLNPDYKFEFDLDKDVLVGVCLTSCDSDMFQTTVTFTFDDVQRGTGIQNLEEYKKKYEG